MERRRWISLEFYIWLFRPKLGEVLMHIYKFEFENGKLVILASEVLVWHQILLLVCAFSSVGAHVYLLQIKCLFTFHFFHFYLFHLIYQYIQYQYQYQYILSPQIKCLCNSNLCNDRISAAPPSLLSTVIMLGLLMFPAILR